uniref:Uncharacterized protein n=1 Tax=Rhizophora mucronata TaxID=61149 RepID=A0A2P2Q228_RHIMU
MRHTTSNSYPSLEGYTHTIHDSASFQGELVTGFQDTKQTYILIVMSTFTRQLPQEIEDKKQKCLALPKKLNSYHHTDT